MKAAIEHLMVAYNVTTSNENANRSAGRNEQADINAKRVEEIRSALRVLRAVDQAREITDANTADRYRKELADLREAVAGLWSAKDCVSTVEALGELRRVYKL